MVPNLDETAGDLNPQKLVQVLWESVQRLWVVMLRGPADFGQRQAGSLCANDGMRLPMWGHLKKGNFMNAKELWRRFCASVSIERIAAEAVVTLHSNHGF